MSEIPVLLADDHALVRAGIRSLLEKMALVRVVAEAGNGRQALELAREHRPKVVLMDIAMSEMNGLDATARLTKEMPEVKVVILSMHASEEYVLQALRSGAAGYLLKDAATAELDQAIRTVLQGETYLSPAISRSAIERYLQRVNQGEPPGSELTPRQREILQMIAEGRNTKEIAFTLGLSVKTVETHRTLMMHRLDIHEIAGLVRYAMRIGLVQAEPGL
jgi:DNA-binding NarL/FixJ family response regulator